MIVDHRAAFLAELSENQHKERGPLGQLRAAAWSRFEEVGLPNRKSEAYKYFPTAQLFSEHFAKPSKTKLTLRDVAPFVLPECANSYVVFVNGRLDFELSNLEGIEGAGIARSFEDAMRSYSAFLTGRLQEQGKKEKDPFALVHAALFDEGLFIYLPAKSSLDVPVQVINLSVNRVEPIMTLPKLGIFAAKETNAELIVTHHALGTESLFTHLAIDAVLEPAARLKITQVAADPNITWGFSTLRADVKAKACLESLHLATRFGHFRFDYSVDLVGQEARADLKGAGLSAGSGKARQSLHTAVDIRHRAPATFSHQLFKRALRKEGLSDFAGKIFVDPIAQQTDAFQLCQHLLLDPSAKAYARPGLEIYADDVKASHGATSGGLESEPKFYLEARGIAKEKIERYLVRAHFKELFDSMECESIERLFNSEVEGFCV